MSSFHKVDGFGEAAIFKGDPRIKETDIDSWYQEQIRETGDASKRPYLYGSDAGLCSRRNVLLEHNTWIPTGKSPATHGYMAIGVGLEDMLAQALRRKERLFVQSQRLVEMPEVKISGKIDLVVLDHKDEFALVEVKSCGKLPLEPKPEHLAQIQTYAAVSGVHRCWITYISRNVRSSFSENIDLRSFPVDCGADILTQRLLTALVSRTASDAASLPPVPASFRKHKECHYCEFRDSFCWGHRPGNGGAEAAPLLREYSPKEMIELEAGLIPIATRLYKESLYRYQKTLNSINTLDLSKGLYDKLNKLKLEVRKELLK